MIKRIADDNRAELGFVLRAALQAAITEQRVLAAVVEGNVVGFIHFRNRRDGVTKVYQLCVDQRHRDRHYGSMLLKAVEKIAQKQKQTRIRLVCPEGLTANTFYERQGFSILETRAGKSRRLIIWHRLVPGADEEV